MKFTCQQQSLSKVLNTVSKAISSRTTMPVLKGILLQAKEDGSLVLTASDMDFSIESSIDVNVEEPGSVVVTAKLFSEIIRKLASQMITVFSDEDCKLTVKTDTSEFTITGMPSEDFPNTGNLEDVTENVVIDRNWLRNMIQQTHFCVSKDEARGIITGVLFEVGTTSFNLATLDGFRMAVSRRKVENQKESSFVIHGNIVTEINKLLAESEEPSIRIVIGHQKAEISLERTKITMRLMDGEFINYRNILQTESNTKMVVSKRALLDSIERASLLAKEGKNNLIIMNTEGNLLTIRSTSEEGRVKEEIIMEKEGNDIEIGFNSKYVIDAIKAIDDEEVVLYMNTAVSPCLIKPVEGDEYEYLILPVRIPTN